MRSFFGLLFNHLEKYNVKYALWIVQVLLAAMFLFAGSMKLVMPIEMLADQTPLPGLFIRFIGVAETLGALGLILPGLLRLRPRSASWSCCRPDLALASRPVRNSPDPRGAKSATGSGPFFVAWANAASAAARDGSRDGCYVPRDGSYVNSRSSSGFRGVLTRAAA